MSPRQYIVLRSSQGPCSQYHLDLTSSDPYDDKLVKSFDQKLHRTLSNIFYEHRFTSDQIKKLICAPRKLTGKNSIFKLILTREPPLGKLLLKRSKLSLLWIAVLSGYQDSAELLVRFGADVNERYRLGGKLSKKSTILHALFYTYPSAWNERFIGLVTDHGADIEAREIARMTALHLAVIKGRVKVVKMLLENGADVNAVRRGNMTPLHASVHTSKVDEMVPLLVRHGADISARNGDGFNVLRLLASFPEDEHVDLARNLIEKGLSPSEEVSDRYHPIHIAAQKGKIELVNLFLDNGADVNAQGFFDESPLFVAARDCQDPAMLLTLLKRGANIDLKSRFGFTALFILVLSQNSLGSNKNAMEKVKILLNFGADMFAKARNGLAPLDVTPHNKDNPIIRLMLKTLALKNSCLQPSAEFKEEMIMAEKYPELRILYQYYIEEINMMKSTRFIESCTIFELLTKCQCKIVPLMRHREFEKKFRLFNLRIFPVFGEDILDAFERAKRYYQSTMDHEIVIDDAARHIFPYTVVRKLAHYALNCELCETKKIAQSSRSILR